MSESLGMILKKLRKEQEIGQKDLCRGICSISTLSRIELGVREPEQILFESLITRLGKDSTKWELILAENDKKLFEKRNYMEYLVQTEQWKKLKKEVEQYEQMRGSSNNMEQQYCHLIRSILYRQEKNYQEAVREGIEGLAKTEFYRQETLFKGNVVVSKNELRILYLIGEIWFEEGEQSILSLYSYWNQLFLYVKERCTDKRYRLEFYIEALYYIVSIFFRARQYGESIAFCKQGIQELIEKRSTYYLKDFLKLLKKLERKQEISSLNSIFSIKNIDTLLETLEFWEEQNRQFREKKRYIRTYNGTYSINEVIKYTRNYRRKTQEDVVGVTEGMAFIGDQSGLSKIENGKRTPRKAGSQYYLESLGLAGKTDYYQLSIRGEDFEIQELRWEIDFYIGIHKVNEAERLLNLLKKKIDLTNPYNEQYVREIELFIKDERNEISGEEYSKEIFSLLSLTLEDVERLKKEGDESGFFTREELVLLMNLGCIYHQQGQYREALKYYHKVEGYLRDFYQFSSAGIYKTVLYNLSQVYGLLGRYEASMEKSRASIIIQMMYRQSSDLCRRIFNIGWCYGKMFLEEEEEEKKKEYKMYCNLFFRQSSSIAEFYRDEEVKEMIKEKRKLWDI